MSRYVDRLPEPARPTPIQRIVVSAPRSGTKGLYFALKLLGYKPYHMAELRNQGTPHVRMMTEFYDAEHDGSVPKYTRKEMDKWLQNFDVFMELPFMSLEATIHAYPNAQYLFVEREADAWATSVQSTVFKMASILNSSYLIRFGIFFVPQLFYMADFVKKFKRRTTNGHGSTPEGKRNMIVNYQRYVAEVKRLIPADQLTHLHLEDGYGWEPICAWLGIEVPDLEWPTRNTTDDFLRDSSKLSYAAKTIGSVAILGSTLTIGLLGWALYTARIPMPFTIRWT